MNKFKEKRIKGALVFFISFGVFTLTSLVCASGVIRAGSFSVVPACGAPGETVTVTFDGQSNVAWARFQYAIGFSADVFPEAAPTDTWVVGGSAGICPQAAKQGPQENATPVWHTMVDVVTIPAGFSGGELILIVGENGFPWSNATCSYQDIRTQTILPACGPPTPTITPTSTVTPTPVLPLVKSANVSQATVGDTITFCIAWTNDSSAFMTRTFYDQLVPQLTYLGGDGGCTVSGQQVTCSFPAAAGASGSQCFWAVVNSAP